MRQCEAIFLVSGDHVVPICDKPVDGLFEHRTFDGAVTIVRKIPLCAEHMAAAVGSRGG